MRRADQYTSNGFAPKERTEAQKAADQARSEAAARARKAKVDRLARQRAARRAAN